jgi:hypothetical protein
MTDQDWGSADGSARGTATGGKRGSDDGRDADADARKVVPFPREWYGSPDELVPIDLGPPKADGTDAANSDTTEAAAFWEGGAGTDHELADPPDTRQHDPSTSSSGVQAEPPRANDRSTPPTPPTRRFSIRPLAVAALLAVLLAGAAAVLVSGLGTVGGTDPGARARRHDAARAVTKTVTTPVTVTTKVPARGTRGRRPSTGAHAGRLSGDGAQAGTAAAQQPATTTQPTSEQGAAPSSETSPPAKTSGGSHSAGTGCAESPDSGCLP